MIKTTIIGFGDSISNGYGVSKSVNYINRLEKFIPSYYPSISWNIINSSKNGITTREALDYIESSVLEHRPNVVFIQFGTNDSATNNKYRSLEEFENNLKNILNQIIKLNNRTGLNNCMPIPILITPPPVNENIAKPMHNNSRLNQYVHIIKTLAKDYNCPIIDFYSKLIEIDNYTNLILDDGIHLNEKGYDLLFDTIFAEFTKLINYEGVLKEIELKIN
ncbi:MAG: GDSL-type esterase/lipase family protein [Vallitalea sp.]|jgi:acyl-CoA thioesterase-1|nr:GDSL-type esterase/lipase family protein [Vallitalea sp.]